MQKSMPMQFATKWNKELNFHDFIEMFEYLLADIVAFKLEQAIKNTDLELNTLAEQYNLEVLFSIYESLQQSKRNVEQNVQTNLIIDQLSIQLMNVS